jgi:hypothetical protein
MKNPKPASLSSSLLARLGEARSAASPEDEAEADAQSSPSPEMQAQHEELEGCLSSEASDEDEALPVKGSEPAPTPEASEKVLPAREVRARVTLTEWAQRSSREMADLGRAPAEERSVPDVAGEGSLRARAFLFVIAAAVLGSLLGLWLGRGERPAAPSAPAANTTIQPGAQATSAIPSRDVAVAPLGPAAPRPAEGAPPPPQAAAAAPQPSPQAQPATVPPAPASALSGAYAVQLASARSEAVAAKEWTKLAQQHAALLGAVTHEIARADLAGKGTFYRLRVGGFDAASEAKDLCTALKAEGQDCLVVKR